MTPPLAVASRSRPVACLWIGILLAAWSTVSFGDPDSPVVPADRPAISAPDSPSRGQVDAERALPALGLTLLVGVVGVLVFLLGTFIFIRTSRRARAVLFRKPPPPTQADDVWSAHRLPDETVENGPVSDEPIS